MGPRRIFVTGATGYLGSRLLPRLLARGHAVTALVRPGSEGKLPADIHAVPGNALDSASLRAALGDCDTWIQLVGTPRPAPWKGKAFRAVDRRAVLASLEALPGSAIRHYLYLSVAHPAPVMRSYIAVRQEGEAVLRARSLSHPPFAATFLRPWYILGPGHRWPLFLCPIYKLLQSLPPTREAALRLGLVPLDRMLSTILQAIENPPRGIRIIEVPEIRANPS